MAHLDIRLATALVPILMLAALACQEPVDPSTEAGMERAEDLAGAQVLTFAQVNAGPHNACGVTLGNQAYCWGPTPERVPGGLAFRQVSAGLAHTCGVTTNDIAYCWGANDIGQLGDGTGIARVRPVRVAGGHAFRQVSAGYIHSCGVTTNNVAYCWGHNQAGELGDGSTNGTLEPVRVARGLAFRQVSGGDQLTCGVTTENVAYCWGMNVFGQLGVGDETGPELCFTGDGFDACSTSPVRVVRGLAFRQVSAGGQHVCGTTPDDVAFCWGINSSGELGNGASTGPVLCLGDVACSPRPVRVQRQLAFAGVSAGESHSCGAATGNAAYCWGSNGSGELGIGTIKGPETCFPVGSPPPAGAPCSTRPVPVLGDLGFNRVEVGRRFGCGLRANNVAFCWGENEVGQLGDGTTQTRPRPRRLSAPS